MAKRAAVARLQLPLLLMLLLWGAGPAIVVAQGTDDAGTSNAAAVIGGGAASFAITSIVVDKSELLDEAAIRNVISEYEGKTVTLADLQRAVDAINALYAQRRIITAKAILPPQSITGGVVRIRLVEGRAGDIVVVDNQLTRKEFILKRIPVKTGDLLRMDRLEQVISRFNRIGETQLTAELKPGKQFGTTDLILTAQEPTAYRGTIFIDNAGRSETGLYRFGVTAVKTSLYGSEDPLTISTVASTGSTAGSVDYSFPIGFDGIRLGFGYNDSGIQVVSGEFEDVEISGHSRDRNFTLSRPLRATPTRKVDVSLESHDKSSSSKIANTFNWSTTRTRTTVLGLSTQSVGEKRVFDARYDVTFGTVDPKNYREPDEQGHFTKYAGAFTWQRLTSDGGVVTFRAALQATSDQLLPFSEQFSVGGTSTVRGYSEGLLVGDQGYFFNLEKTVAGKGRARGFVFLDHGAAFPFKGNDEHINSKDFLTSVGFGATVDFGFGLVGKVSVGIPTKAGYDPVIHALIQESF